MTCPRETVGSTYSYRTVADSGAELGFREVSLDRDLGRLHAWLNSDHVLPYWQQDDPLPQVRDTIRERAADETQTLYVGYRDHVPMSYWESYWAAHDRLADHYDADPGDQGIHLLIGPTEYLGRGYAAPLIRAMVDFQFQHPETTRVVTEPDARNERAIRAFAAAGFERRGEIEFPDKTAQFMVRERETGAADE
ncbi:RimJ/RimL family protein N-acetyltransferase [Halarchaeum rubridurum]|uniref:N-acetyltransferase n=1 Tax=Halarchaeum rubridurum TaxID=489911 RepID=A0A830FUA4_9EURY|nr:GNAT family N-acetyltransferase [Halarchaeum rubridurum]MBP1954382.1 RimJ/RimL family protein N-acetyltransferase [Halarchaeum rubridurum]GGM60515.1 N-acetyltransferase [Halarchaeum rubridurum]